MQYLTPLLLAGALAPAAIATTTSLPDTHAYTPTSMPPSSLLTSKPTVPAIPTLPTLPTLPAIPAIPISPIANNPATTVTAPAIPPATPPATPTSHPSKLPTPVYIPTPSGAAVVRTTTSPPHNIAAPTSPVSPSSISPSTSPSQPPSTTRTTSHSSSHISSHPVSTTLLTLELAVDTSMPIPTPSTIIITYTATSEPSASRTPELVSSTATAGSMQWRGRCRGWVLGGVMVGLGVVGM